MARKRPVWIGARARLLPRLFALLLLALFALRIWDVVQVTSLTTDEGFHIVAGHSYLADRDFRINDEHPPLAKLWAVALPYFTLERAPIRSLDYPATPPGIGRLVGDFFRSLGDGMQPFIDRSRYGAALLSALLAVVLYGAAVWLYGNEWIALLVVGVYTLEPTVLAHSPIVHTDIGSALGYLLGFISLCAWWKAPSLRRTGLVAAAVAIGCLLKFSMVVLPLFGLLVLSGKILTSRSDLRRYAAQGLVAAGIFYFVLLAGYLFADLDRSPADFQGWNLIPFPRHFVHGVSTLFDHQQNGHGSYLFGRFSQRGWWYYFPVAAALKFALPTLIWWLVGAVCWIRVRKGIEGNLWIAMAATYLAASMASSINIGVRHLMPLVPLLTLASGEALLALGRRSRALAGVFVAVTIGWLALSSARIHPHYLAYFNELAGGAGNGWRYLSDSNSDWSQASRMWHRYREQHPGTHFFNLSDYGGAENVLERFSASRELPEGTYAASTWYLLSRRVSQLAYLRELEPVDHVGYVLRIYRIGPPEVQRYGQWLATWKPDATAAY
ncbi:MAG: hypothetical protein ACR2L2_20970 [Acidobacteriota bacterium]